MVGLCPVTCRQNYSICFGVAKLASLSITIVNIIHSSISPLPRLSNLAMKFWKWDSVNFFHDSGKFTLYLSLIVSSWNKEMILLVFMAVPASDSREKNFMISRIEDIVKRFGRTCSVAGRMIG